MSDHDAQNDHDEQQLYALLQKWHALQEQVAASGSTKSLENRLLFAAFINALMEQRGLSTLALADAIDTTEEYILTLLRGELPLYRLSEDILTRMAHVFDLSPGAFTAFVNKTSAETRRDQDNTENPPETDPPL